MRLEVSQKVVLSFQFFCVGQYSICSPEFDCGEEFSKMLTVTAQQSRFHNEAIEGSALKEVGTPLILQYDVH